MSQKPKVKSKNSNSQFITLAIVAAAVVVAIVAIVLSSSNTSLGGVSIDYSTIEQDRMPDGGYVLGNPDAPITIVAFEDFLCPHCQSYQPTIKQFIADYVATGKARFEFRMLAAVNPTYSNVAASLAQCADIIEPGSFWTAHDLLFQIAASEAFSDRSARTFSERMNMSYASLLDCQNDVSQANVDRDLATASNVTGTPTVMIRLENGPLQPSPVGPRPTVQQLGQIVDSFQ